MDDATDEQARRDARSVEIVLALLLGCATFAALAVAGWALARLGPALHIWLVASATPLLIAAAAAGAGVTLAQLVRARRRGI